MRRHVALVGFMASGKTTIGRKLARRLGVPFVDTDAVIVRDHGPIVEIFSSDGEESFRRHETAVIGEVLARPEASVIALGGGALTLAQNRKLLEASAYRVFIKISPKQILARVRRSREVRPMLGPAPTLMRVKALYQQRLPDYATSDRVVDAEHRNDREVVDEIVSWLRDMDERDG